MRWPKNIEEAREIQHKLKEKIKIIPLKKTPRLIAGVDAAFLKDRIIGAACIYEYPGMKFVEYTYAITRILFPYIPGFLSFREGPAIIKAIKGLKIKPDIILFDGQGIAHPEGTGIATHIGVLLNTPSIGCAKSRLIGDYSEPALTKGSYTFLRHKGRTIGAVLRTRDNVSPVYVSPGHLINLKETIDIVLNCTTNFRIPEPLRHADHLSKKLKSSSQIIFNY
jgi:deoxyribonuclease V